MADESPKDDSAPATNISGVNLGDLSKPATMLVEKVSNAVGGIFKPYQIVRVAKAEAEAQRIRAEGEIAVTDIHRRAFRRFLEEEARNQKNIETITSKALPQLQNEADPRRMEDDWIANFFEKCRIVSDADMQILWSKVLAGEANEPGSYSKRTLTILSLLTKEEAELFTLYGSFLWQSANGARYAIDSDAVSQFWPSKSVPFDVAQDHLRDIGVIGPSGARCCDWSKLPQREFIYFDESYRFKFGSDYQEPAIEPLFCTFTYLTAAGYQLIRIAEAKKIVGYAEAVIKGLANQYARYKLQFERVAG